jgi:serine/threonine protein kinase
MPLMSGNLKTLVVEVGVPDEQALSDIVLKQMLLALECIAAHRIIHRDVKPENILWELDEVGGYRFRLGDFGLSNDPSLARTAAGTEPFMAPEVFNRQPQSTKVDIWSLFATIVWTRTLQFRRHCSQMRVPELHIWLVQISRMEQYANIRKMASMDPKKRPSAKKQLAILEAPPDATGGYGGASGDEHGDDLNAHFSRAMNLREDMETPGLTYGSGSSEMVSPELPYYEPYASGLFESLYPGQAGPSKRYVPPSPDPADAPRDQGVRHLLRGRPRHKDT